ncbi:hypothetical protein LV779_31860 [Streptomyces thinghirensis]|nr:hypothetical protein [Streptomyces thinghirensis]
MVGVNNRSTQGGCYGSETTSTDAVAAPIDAHFVTQTVNRDLGTGNLSDLVRPPPTSTATAAPTSPPS